ncbi:hypothetical protein [uncultured Polaribacter sp.]|uniref:hypothetical protein n=1 Tax=uncultured Polaribacter sp. TaxID=174711 RepID=UPI0026046C72|nr:hypothetical protein [uncultured Polaribacter sp.]
MSEEITKVNLEDALKDNQIKADSIKKIVAQELEESFIPLTKNYKKEILAKIEAEAKDSIKRKKIRKNKISFKGTKFDDFITFQKKNPKLSTDIALDSLKQKKSFKNRFLYQKSKTVNELSNNKDVVDRYVKEALSYSSIALFIFLPIFTLFLKFLYLRRKYTYVDHLIFVFHTQTVLFILLSIATFTGILIGTGNWGVFLFVFLIYLFLAMKNFYNQGYGKTILKFLFLNFSYAIIGTLSIVLVAIVSFALF